MKDFIKKYSYYLIGFILIQIIIGLWLLDFKNQSVNLMILGLVIWLFKYVLDRHNQKVEKQNQIFLQKNQGGIEFKKTILEDMYNISIELWKKAVWIRNNRNALYPGNDSNIEKKKEFKQKFDEYKNLLQINSINIPLNINEIFNDITRGIIMYEIGRERKEGKWGTPDQDDKIKGLADMSNGSKLVNESISKLFEAIREEFGIANLPGEMLDVKQPN